MPVPSYLNDVKVRIKNVKYDKKAFIEENRSGSTQEYIPLGGLRSIAFKVPPQQMLNSFNAIVSPFFDKFFQNQTQILILEKLRDTLLPKLMSGEVRVEV